ncbi:hypothetical protein [Paractinoplanes rishiriensis]|uniref:hypothetical protein n=1 Tax=Paractinoplanes rishiriensis TaxID=1050105 RepID=UPI001940DC66|nr:hypothetical protein [Actinoplanes rishiriensis]
MTILEGPGGVGKSWFPELVLAGLVWLGGTVAQGIIGNSAHDALKNLIMRLEPSKKSYGITHEDAIFLA